MFLIPGSGPSIRKDRGQEVVSERRNAIVPARPGCCLASGWPPP